MTVGELKSALNCLREDADVYFDVLTTRTGEEVASVDSFRAENPGANNYQIILQGSTD